jgi:hypothetical protein
MNVLGASAVPGAPAGPGVRAPFAAPPTERDRRRLWTGIGIGALLFVLCCGGGIIGFGTLVVAQTRALPNEAVAVVTRYLEGLRDEDYAQSYDLLCGSTQERENLAHFTARQRAQPRLSSFTVGQSAVLGNEVVVTADLTRGDSTDRQSFQLYPDQEAGGLRICGGG